MSCCYKHQQQRYRHENAKICIFIHYIHIIFPLTKSIPIMFERVTTQKPFTPDNFKKYSKKQTPNMSILQF